MTEWSASEYARISGLQKAMAEEVLSLLDLNGTKRVLDVGCGNGRVTAEIASRIPQGTVIGVDSSASMVAFASSHYGPAGWPNLRFEIADARRLPFQEEFDLVVSLNALHWIREQDKALRSIRSAMKPDGAAQLRLVPAGKRKSLENVIEETRLSSKWVRYFQGFRDPYLHFTPEQYGELAERDGLHICRIHTQDNSWDFESRSAFLAFGSVTFIEWTQFIPEAERLDFVTDVLDRYRTVAADQPGEENTFKFYQMDITPFASLRQCDRRNHEGQDQGVAHDLLTSLDLSWSLRSNFFAVRSPLWSDGSYDNSSVG
ncbi:MAG TPA: methyltransferase domain-containing protein [Terrimicrobiaceae bacterium]